MAAPRYQRFKPKFDWLFLAGVLVYVICFFAFYPRITAIVDENAYLTQAFLFKSGKLAYDQGNIPLPMLTFDMRAAGGHIVSKYQPGNSMFLVPFLYLGWQGVFLSGLICALVGVWFFTKILNRFAPEIEPSWSLLYLYYPTVIVYSRTVMSDLPATTAILGSFCFLLRGKGWLFLAGLLFGLGIFFRYPILILLPAWLGILLIRKNRAWEMATFLLGLCPFILLALAYNRYAFGGYFKLPMWTNDRFALSFIPHHLVFYSLPLIVWYPLMLFSPIFAPKGYRLTLLLPSLFLILFYSTFSYTPAVKNLAERVVIGLRYLLPILPFFIIGFALFLRRMSKTLMINPVWLRWSLLMPIALGVIVQIQHHRYLSTQEYYARTLLKTVPVDGVVAGNKEVIELLNVAWGWRDWLPLDSLANPGFSFNRPVYAALLEKSAPNEPETIFQKIMQNFPNRTPVITINRPYRFQVVKIN